MDWTNFDQMDPHLLVGLVNTAIRNHFESLEELCHAHDLDESRLRAHLAQAGYEYLEQARQFR